MEERDAFGRAKGEDPLAEMGWSSSDVAEVETAPAGVPAPVEPEPAQAPPPTPYRPRARPAPLGIPRQRRRRGTALGCVFPLIVLAFIVSVFAVVVPMVIDAVESVEEATDGGDGPRTEQREPPTGLSGESLLRRDNLAPALDELRRETGADRVFTLRLAADRLDIVTVLRDGRRRSGQARWDGEVTVSPPAPAVGAGGPAPFPWSRIDPAAPNRIVRATTRGRSAASFDYAVLIDAPTLRWTAFLKGGRFFQASLDGRRVTRVGG